MRPTEHWVQIRTHPPSLAAIVVTVKRLVRIDLRALSALRVRGSFDLRSTAGVLLIGLVKTIWVPLVLDGFSAPSMRDTQLFSKSPPMMAGLTSQRVALQGEIIESLQSERRRKPRSRRAGTEPNHRPSKRTNFA